MTGGYSSPRQNEASKLTECYMQEGHSGDQIDFFTLILWKAIFIFFVSLLIKDYNYNHTVIVFMYTCKYMWCLINPDS